MVGWLHPPLECNLCLLHNILFSWVEHVFLLVMEIKYLRGTSKLNSSDYVRTSISRLKRSWCGWKLTIPMIKRSILVRIMYELLCCDSQYGITLKRKVCDFRWRIVWKWINNVMYLSCFKLGFLIWNGISLNVLVEYLYNLLLYLISNKEFFEKVQILSA